MTAPSIGALPSPRQVIFRVEALADPRIRLFLTSATLLFVELLLIRWIPANVRYVGFFSNFLLMASFLGIGLGILLGRKGWRLPFSPFTLLLFVVVALVVTAELNVQINSQDELFFGLAENTAADANFIVLPLVVGLVAAVMASLALPLGPLFRAMPPLRRLRHRHRRLDGRHHRLHGTLGGRHEPGRLVQRARRPRPADRAGRGHHALVVRGRRGRCWASSTPSSSRPAAGTSGRPTIGSRPTRSRMAR